MLSTVLSNTLSFLLSKCYQIWSPKILWFWYFFVILHFGSNFAIGIQKKLSFERFGHGIQRNTEYGIQNTECCRMYLGRSTGCNGTPRSNTEITCYKLVCVSFSLICHLHFDQPKASHKELLLKSITTVMLALTTPVMWTFVLICITGTHSH